MLNITENMSSEFHEYEVNCAMDGKNYGPVQVRHRRKDGAVKLISIAASEINMIMPGWDD